VQKLLAMMGNYLPYKVRRGLALMALDYSSKFSFDEMYQDIYEKDSLEGRRFYNFGAGNFYHKYWSNIEAKNSYDSRFQKRIQIEYNFTARDPIPVPDDSAEICYTSHVIEHLRDADVAHIFSEVHRMLKPGGVFRITCPDVDQAYQAAESGNLAFFKALVGNRSLAFDLDGDVGLAYYIAQQLVLKDDGLPIPGFFRYSAKRGTKSREEIFDELCGLSSDEYQSTNPVHINWWNHEKVSEFLRRAGFTKIENSSYGHSSCMVMRDVNKFDNTWPQISLYVEAIKG
jgi:SAM-dependent methyltransferase